MKLRPLLDKFDSLASCLQSPLLFVIRFYWGLAFAQDGWGKFAHLDKIVNYFTELGIPLPKLNAIMASSTELFCGSLLLVGLFSRIASVPLIFTMLVAYITADYDSLRPVLSDLHRFITHLDFKALAGAFDDADKFVTATPFLFMLAALIVLAFGPGKLSLDHLFFRRKSAS